MKKSLTAAAIVGSVAALMMLGIPAAQAAAPVDLPAGQDLYAIDCEDFGPQLWRIAPSGAATPVGDAYLTATGDACAAGGQRNPVTGVSYFIYYPGGPETQLATVELTTGAVGIVGTLTGDTDGAWQFFITNAGTAYITSNNADSLYTIDLGTAVTTFVATIGPDVPDTVAYNPVNDTIYGIDRDDVINVYTLDRLTGVMTNTGLTGTWPTATCLGGGTNEIRPDALVFDAAGFGWVQSDSCNSVVMSVDLSDASAVIGGELFDATGTIYPTAPNDFYSETFIIGPAPAAAVVPAAVNPALAATGVDTDAVVILAGASALAVLLGATLMMRRRAGV